MKKIMIVALMAAFATTAFSQEDVVKQILKSKDYNEASSLLKANMNTLTAEQKAKAYNQLVDLSMAKVQKEQSIINANQVAEQLKQGKTEAYDTLGFYNAVTQALQAGIECDKYDQMPNDKGKVKPKFHSSNQQRLYNLRVYAINGGQYFGQKQNNADAFNNYSMYVESANSPLFSDMKKERDPYLGEVARVAAVLAFQNQDLSNANKYVDVALNDTASAKDALDLKMYIMQTQLKSKSDSLNYVSQLEGIYAKDAKNDKIFGTLCNMYTSLGNKAALDKLLNDRLATDPNNYMAWAVKGQNAMNDRKWDDAITAYKKALEIRPDESIILTYLGFSINNKAQEATDRMAGKTGRLAPAAEQQIRDVFKQSITYLEKAKQLDPNREKSNWAYPLYQSYYRVYGPDDAKTKEMEALTK